MTELKPLKPKPAAKAGPTLTFSDGLNFGCGFFVAGALFSLFAVPATVFAITFLTALLTRH